MKLFILIILASIIYFNSFSQSDWKPLGPAQVPFNQGGGGASGIGRVTCLRFHPGYNGAANKIMFLGTPDGGLWRSATGGNDWEYCNTDKLPVIGVSDLAIHPGNPLIMYIASGDPDGLFDPYAPCGGNQATASRGIFKSVDGGMTWDKSPIGNWFDLNKKPMNDFWKYPTRKLIPRLIINPGHSEILIAIVSELNYSPTSYDGYVFQSKDGGQNWFMKLNVRDGFFRDLELMPGNPNVIYVGGRKIYKSSNNGKKWKMISSFADSLKDIRNIRIAVTKAAPKYIYANVSPMGLIYKSADGGKTFKIAATGVNNGMDPRFVLAVSPLEKETVFFNMGNFVNYFFADAPKKKFYSPRNGTHADIHDLNFAPDSNLIFISCDGGIYKAEKKDSISWVTSDISNGINIAKIHRIGVSQRSGKLLAGAQDVGSLLYDPVTTTGSQKSSRLLSGGSQKNYPASGLQPLTSENREGSWTTISGGDGAECIIDFTNDSILYRSDGQGGSNMSRSDDGGKRWTGNLLPRDAGGGSVVKPFRMNPVNANTIYFAFKDIVKNTNRGNGKWEKISRFTTDFPEHGDGWIYDFRIAPSDTNVIYCAFGGVLWSGDEKDEKYRLFKTADGGSTWKDITKGLKGVDWADIYSIAINPRNPDSVFVGFMGCDDVKCMASFDGGNTWRNFSEDLPAESQVNSIVIDKTKNDGSMYAGTIRGVFYRNNSSGKWIPYSNGLPNSLINEVEINYFNRKLYAATYGRGVWCTKLYAE
jgi:photosystem II stability/assembly factor-like uncharacterized protein